MDGRLNGEKQKECTQINADKKEKLDADLASLPYLHSSLFHHATISSR
jgi:hypothetical protein